MDLKVHSALEVLGICTLVLPHQSVPRRRRPTAKCQACWRACLPWHIVFLKWQCDQRELGVKSLFLTKLRMWLSRTAQPHAQMGAGLFHSLHSQWRGKTASHSMLPLHRLMGLSFPKKYKEHLPHKAEYALNCSTGGSRCAFSTHSADSVWGLTLCQLVL